MRISDWSSDVCSSDLGSLTHDPLLQVFWRPPRQAGGRFASYRTKAAPLTQDASASTDPTVVVDRWANATCRHNAALRHQHTVQYGTPFRAPRGERSSTFTIRSFPFRNTRPPCAI